ncbi:hypothetical protein J6590_019500 [Homalodisca vitripennis]|nr:hypothetical protein J6590_019500 [Homalodisca vitripennis]
MALRRVSTQRLEVGSAALSLCKKPSTKRPVRSTSIALSHPSVGKLPVQDSVDEVSYFTPMKKCPRKPRNLHFDNQRRAIEDQTSCSLPG